MVIVLVQLAKDVFHIYNRYNGYSDITEPIQRHKSAEGVSASISKKAKNNELEDTDPTHAAAEIVFTQDSVWHLLI